MIDSKHPTEHQALFFFFLATRTNDHRCRYTVCVFFSREETGPFDLESKWVAFFNYEVVNERIYYQDILICLLLVRNGTKIEEGESLIKGLEGIQVL
jgi:hypothetical protein